MRILESNLQIDRLNSNFNKQLQVIVVLFQSKVNRILHKPTKIEEKSKTLKNFFFSPGNPTLVTISLGCNDF